MVIARQRRAGRRRQGAVTATALRRARAATYADTYTLASGSTGNEEDARTWCRRPTSGPTGASKRFRGDAQFTTWLYRITANCASTQLAQRAGTATTSSTDDAPVADDAPEHRSRGQGRGGADCATG